jgi:hypothetical protein
MLSNTKPLSTKVRTQIMSLLEDALSIIGRMEAECAEIHALLDEGPELDKS